MKGISLTALSQSYDIDVIEKSIIYNYLQENQIDYSASRYITHYLTGFRPDATLITSIKSLNHTRIEEIVVDMELLMPSEDKKTNGAFFTPQYIVDYIIETVSPSRNAKVIDPSCGSGAFLLGLLRYFTTKFGKSITEIVSENIYGADILEYNVRRSKVLIILYALTYNEIIDEGDLNVYIADSLKYKWPIKFDAVVGNPPYVKFQDLDDATRTYLFENYSTTKLGTYNLYFAFFELGLSLLSENGKLGYITPNNYFTSLSGEPLRLFFQQNRSIYQIVDFDSTKVFDVQTYTAITFLNKTENTDILYDRIERGELPKSFLDDITLTPNKYSNLAAKKWRLLCGNEIANIKAIENCGESLGSLMNICVGIATLKDEVYFIDPINSDDRYYYMNKKGHSFKIEKGVTRPLVKISDMKMPNDVLNNQRRIIFPYKYVNGKATPIEEIELAKTYPCCYEYLLSVKDILAGRGKGKHQYTPFYIYGRSQGLNRTGLRVYTPTFSLKPRFILDSNEESFFTNGYGLFHYEDKCDSLFGNDIAKTENVDVLLKILNSSIMDYYVTKTSVAIEGGYPCYQKNFIERFTIPNLSETQINNIRALKDSNEIDMYLSEIYKVNLT